MWTLSGATSVLPSCQAALPGLRTSTAEPRITRARMPLWLAISFLAIFSTFHCVAAPPSSTTTSLSATPATSASSSVITMTAHVSASGVPVPRGTVTFLDTYKGVSATLGTIQVQSANGVAGTAVLQTEIGGVGAHSITATFGGTSAFLASSSSTQTVTFTPFYGSATDVAIAGSAGNYSLTATVSAFGPNAPTGKVTFSNTTANLALGSASLDPLSLKTGFTPVRSYPIANLTSSSSSAAAAPAIGDFNGDGKPDFVVPTAAGPVVILLGKGDGTFTAAASLTASTPSSAVVGDFNGDGKQDVAVLNTNGAGSISVFLGNGDGTFQSPRTFSAANSNSDSRILAVGDFNGDGIQDLVASNHGLDQVAVLLGNGDGTFQPATFYATGSQPWNLVVGDINNDGKQDIVVADDNDANVTVLLGNGDGTFRQGTYPSIPGSQSGSVVLGDFNKDGNLDLAVTDQGNNNIFVLIGKGDGTFKSAVTYNMNGGPYYLTVGDFNRDGKVDIISANFAGASVGIMLGNGDGTFNAPTYYPTGGGTIFAAVGDLNGDDQVDVAAVTANALSILLAGQAETATINAVNVHGCGAQSVTATYSGDTTYNPSTSSAVALTPTALPTATSLSVAPTSSAYGQQVTLTATVAPFSYGNVTTNGETVTFKNGASVLGTATLASGVATLNTTSLPLGTNSLTAVYAADCAFQTSTSPAVASVISKGTPVITWANPSAITYGTALSAVQLNATANVPGTFVYTPSSGTILSAGTHTLSVTFTPTDSVDYLPATATVTLVVGQATPTLTWGNPAPITYGTVLTAAQLNATANVPGTFVYSPAAGAVLTAGAKTLNVTFTPTDGVNYANATASVNITVNEAAPVVTWATPAPITYGTALSATQLNATASVPGTFAYSPAAGTVLAVGNQTLNVTFTPTDAANYTTVTASVKLTVGKATPVITWATPASIQYGTALGVTQLNATASVPGTFAYSPAAGTILAVGTQTLSVTFTPTDAVNYTTATASVSLTVTKATPTLTWAQPSAITYGTALSATQLSATASVPGTFVYTPATGTVLAAGSHTLSVTFTPTDSVNYTTATASVSLTVNKATPAITWAQPAPITYGTALGATQLNATASVPGAFVYSPAAGTVLISGSQTLSVTFIPTDTANYTTATSTVMLTVNAAASQITWAQPAPIAYGTALSAMQLNATASAPGTFAYAPAAGTVLSVGSHTLTVTFTPTDSVNYTTATASVSLTVNKATPVITWAQPAPIAYGTALSATQLNATASVPGTFAYTPAAGTVLPAGSQTLNVTFTPTDAASYTTASSSVTLTVNAATSLITWAQPAAITYGTALSATQLNATASVPGTFIYTPVAGAVLSAGPHTLNVTFTPTDSLNYTTATASVSLTVNKATPVITWGQPAPIAYGTALGATQLNAAASVPGTFAYAPAAGTVLSAGPQTLSVTFAPTDTANYTTATSSVTLTVNAGTSLITWAQPAPISYGTALGATQLNATASVPGTFTYTPAVGTVLSVGAHTLNVTFTPTDSVNYTTATASVSLTVNKATPVITWAQPTPIAYGTALGATQLNAAASVPGVFVYTPAAGVVPTAGAQTLNVTFTPTDTANYTTATASVGITVSSGTSLITWGQPAAITYGTPLSVTQLHATASVPGTFVYTPAAGTVLAAGLHALSVTFTPTDTVNYSTATASVSLTVNKATPGITWTQPSPIAYGTALSATQLNATAAVPGTFAYTPTTGTLLAAGTQTLNVTFTPTDTVNYTTATASVTLTVNNATSLVTWAQPAAITYGTALSAAQLNATASVPGTFAYTPPAGAVLAAGSHTLNVTFTPTDTANYAAATASVSLTVNKATPLITWVQPAPIAYGTALGTGQLNATASVPGTFVYTPAAGAVLPAGTQTLSVAFTPTDTANYTTATSSVNLTVTNGTSLITWAQPAAITYGTALSPTQLNATASVPGTFAYTPPAGVVLAAGSHTLNVTFTPTDTANYAAATASVSLTVNKATPVLTWAQPAPITYGTALSATQLNATASVPGTFAYTPAAGAFLTAGTQTLSVTFTPTDSANYTSATTTVNITVSGGTSLITWAQPAPITYGTALSAAQLNATASVPGTFVYTSAAGTVLTAGPHTLGVAFNPTDSTNYSSATATVTILVNQATLQVIANDATRAYGVANPVFTGTITGAVNSDAFTEAFSTPAVLTSPAGKYPIVPAVSGAALSNYNVVITNGTLTVGNTTLTIDANDMTRSYGQPNPTFTGHIVGALNGDTFTETFTTTATAASPVGSYAIVPSVSGANLANYVLVVKNGALAVTKATLTVTANNQSRAVGAPDPTFSAAITGFIGSDTMAISVSGQPAFATTAVASSPSGTYPIMPSLGTLASSNYSFTFVPGTLTISGNSLLVQANDATRIYGAPNPPFTSTITGAQSGDTFTETYATTAGVGSTPGTYPITVVPAGPNLANYVLAVKPGTLTVTKAPTTITTSSPANQVILNAPVTLSATVSSTTTGSPTGVAVFFDGPQQIGTGNVSNGVAILTTTFATVGSHNVTVTYSGDANFLGASSPVLAQTIVPPFVIAVTPNPITVASQHTAHMALTITPATGFSGTVAISCSGIHKADSVCTLGASTLTFTAGVGTPQTTNLDVTTSLVPLGAINSPFDEHAAPLLPALSFWIPGLVFGGFGMGGERNRKEKRLFLVLLLLLGLAGGLAGCGSGRPQESGTYTVQIQGQGGAGAQSYTQTLQVVINIQKAH